MGKLIIRVDANPQVGSGHLLRCLALAQGLKAAGNEVIFLTATEGGLLERLKNEGFKVCLLDKGAELKTDALQTRKIAQDAGAGWVVTDGNKFDEEYQRLLIDYPKGTAKLSQGRTKLLCVDDMAMTHFVADIVLNQNIAVSRSIYSCEGYTKLLLGPEYALIRQEFLRAREGFARKFPSQAKNILVTFGGWDPRNLTLTILQAIESINDTTVVVKVIVGALNPHLNVLRSFISGARSNFEILTDIGDGMPELMKWADMVITTVGITLWELCLFQTPTIVGLYTDNVVADKRKKEIAVALAERDAVKNLGWLADLDIQELTAAINKCMHDSNMRREMGRSMSRVVDGKGAEKVVSIIGSNDENTKIG